MQWEYLAQPQCGLSLEGEASTHCRNDALRCPVKLSGRRSVVRESHLWLSTVFIRYVTFGQNHLVDRCVYDLRHSGQRPPLESFADRGDEDFSPMRCAAMFKKENALPCA